MASLTTKERDAARFMSLDGAAASEPAKSAVRALSKGLVHQRRKRPTSRYQSAVAAILCDFLRAAHLDQSNWSYRSLRPEAFTGQRIGYRTCTTALNDMRHEDMLEVSGGQQQWTEGFASGKSIVSWSRATRLRANEWLLRYMADLNVLPACWGDHFSLIPAVNSLVKDPLVLRRRNVSLNGEKYRGHSIRLDLNDAKTRAHHDRVDRLNRFMNTHEVSPTGLIGFRRIFNNGETGDFNWNKGGRLYEVGTGYQTMPKADRSGLTIDGEAVAEVDVRASFISILSVIRKMPLDPLLDPYEIEGLPRTLVKTVVTMTLGHDRFHKRWPAKTKAALEEALAVKLATAFPLKKVLPLIVERLPALADWGMTDVTCFDLQFIESEALLLAIERLAYEHDIAALPLHDGLVVPLRHIELAKEILAHSFEKLTGHKPYVKVSEGELEKAEV